VLSVVRSISRASIRASSCSFAVLFRVICSRAHTCILCAVQLLAQRLSNSYNSFAVCCSAQSVFALTRAFSALSSSLLCVTSTFIIRRTVCVQALTRVYDAVQPSAQRLHNYCAPQHAFTDCVLRNPQCHAFKSQSRIQDRDLSRFCRPHQYA